MSLQPDPTRRDPVRLILDFLNTVDVEEDTDAYEELSGFQAWVQQHLGLAAENATKQAWHAARGFRDAVRTAVGATPAAELPASAVPVQLQVSTDGTVSLSGHTPTEMVAAAIAELAVSGDWTRVKICPADDCQWAFYDRSRNQSRQWCSMAVCGNRAKARAHRQRVG